LPKKGKEEGDNSLLAVVTFFAALQLSCNSAKEKEGDSNPLATIAFL